jgi:hypothetical protein
MSLSDLVPAVLACKMPRQPAREPGRAAAQRRYRTKHRAQINAYRRAWYAKRKAARWPLA